MKNIWLSDKMYNLIYSRVPRLCVDIVIKTPSGILLTKRDIAPYKGTWHLPGGRVAFRETVLEAVQKIARKELGISVKIAKAVGFMEFLKESQNGNKRHSVSIAFLVKPQNVKDPGTWKNQKMRFFVKQQKNIHPVNLRFLLANKYLKK